MRIPLLQKRSVALRPTRVAIIPKAMQLSKPIRKLNSRDMNKWIPKQDRICIDAGRHSTAAVAQNEKVDE